MTKPFLLLQLSDPHIGADWPGGDPALNLTAAVQSALALSDAPDAVLVSGDIANSGRDEEYALARRLLEPLGAPIHVLPGNHDDRSALRRHFELPGTGAEPIQYSVDLGAIRLVALDSTRPAEDRGELDGERLEWLESELQAEPKALTAIALHHPPLLIGIRALDDLVLPRADRDALAAVLDGHPQVRLIVTGHVHRAIAAGFAGRTLVTVPSTHLEARLDFHASGLDLIPEPPAYAVHAVIDGEIVSHIQPVIV